MSKRSRSPGDDSSSSASSTSKRRFVSVATVDKWVLDHDKTLNTATWLTWIKFFVSGSKALPLSDGILPMLWDYGGQTKQDELMPVVIQLQENTNRSHSQSLKTMKNLTGVFRTEKTG